MASKIPLYSVPWSVLTLHIGPKIRIHFSTIALAMVLEDLSGNGTIVINFVRSHCKVTAYLFPECVSGNGPTVSMDTISNALAGVVVTTA